jgi:hypothetical protein
MEDPRKRTLQSPDDEIMDEDEQQKIIDELEVDYGKVVRTEKYLGGGIAILAFTACSFGAFHTGIYTPFLFSGGAFITVLFWLCHRTWSILGISIVLELLSILAWYSARDSFDKILPWAVHALYFIHAAFAISSNYIVKQFPMRISNLKHLKYGVKLA